MQDGSITVRSATKSTIIIDKDEVSVPISLDRVIKLPQAPKSAEPIAKLLNDMGQSGSDMQTVGEESNPPPADPHGLNPAKSGNYQIAGSRGTGNQAERKSRWYRCSAEENTYAPVSELPSNFIRRY